MRYRTTSVVWWSFLGEQSLLPLPVMSVQQNQLGQLLYEVGWLPINERLEFQHADDLLPSVREIWARYDLAALRPKPHRRAERMQSWLGDQIANGAQLTLLNTEFSRASQWIGERLLWWPHGRPTGSQVGIASSRRGRRLDTQADWFAVLRAACLKINRREDVLLTAAATTPDRYVCRASELFGVRVASMICPQDSESIHAWFNRIGQFKGTSSAAIYRAYVSPELWPSQESSASLAQLAELPIRDRAVVSMAERLFVFHLRRGGHLEKLVRARLNDPTWSTASLFIALGEDLVDRELAGDLLDQGAVGWVVLDTLRHDETIRTRSPPSQKAPIIALSSLANCPWLTHCTRAQARGWPDQRETDYLDELLLNQDASDHSAFAALQRIIATQRLVATSRMIRGDADVVCFTATLLRELPSLRSFRSHLARWDFEPYGICIRQDWLSHRRCQPVRYGDDSLWASMAEQERPFFQVRTSRSRHSEHAIEWSVEREWRHVGDVDLSELPDDAGVIFVPTREEAEQLAAISRWPVTVLGS